MADATDLKSVLVKTGCGFESRHRHPLKRGLYRENYQSIGFGGRAVVRTDSHRIEVYLPSIRQARCGPVRKRGTRKPSDS